MSQHGRHGVFISILSLPSYRQVGEEARILLNVRKGHAVGRAPASTVVKRSAAVRDVPGQPRLLVSFLTSDSPG